MVSTISCGRIKDIDSISNVKIELYKEGVLELEIYASTPNNGEYSWTIPSDLSVSTQYQIKITDVSNPSTYAFSESFEIFIGGRLPDIPGYDLLIISISIIAISIILIRKRLVSK